MMCEQNKAQIMADSEKVRINKRMAELGLCSRREADTLIDKGQVLVNDEPALLGQKVSLTDKITLKGKQTEKKYLAYYKGRGIVTHSPENDDIDIATKIKTDYGLTDLYPVGRLDKDSEGLILLTNDGRVTGPLLDPAAGHAKEYEIVLDKPANNWFFKHMMAGVNIEGYLTKPAEIVETKNKRRFNLIITEGKKHQIRRMCAALGYQVDSLKRSRIANIELGSLKPNQFRKLNKEEQKKLFELLHLN